MVVLTCLVSGADGTHAPRSQLVQTERERLLCASQLRSGAILAGKGPLGCSSCLTKPPAATIFLCTASMVALYSCPHDQL